MLIPDASNKSDPAAYTIVAVEWLPECQEWLLPAVLAFQEAVKY
jgi:hypothetical protein